MSFKNKAVIATIVAAFASTAAVANESGSFVGPFLQDPDAARAAAFIGAENRCASFGGLQSAEVTGVVQNAGFYAFRIAYVCNI